MRKRVRGDFVDGKLLRRLMEKKGLTQEKLATKADVTKRTVQSMLAGGGRRDYDQTIVPISRALGVLPTEVIIRHGLAFGEDMQQMIDATKHEAIINLERLGIQPRAMDGLLLPWMTPEKEGIPGRNVEVKSSWEIHQKEGAKEGWISGLPEIGDAFRKYIDPYWKQVQLEYKTSKPKIWIENFSTPFRDREVILELYLGQTDFFITKCLEEAFKKGGLREAYENRIFDVLEDLPGLAAVVPVIITKDNHLILAQRATRKRELAFGRGAWTISAAEHWDPLEDSSPDETVIRCLEEEFHLDSDHGVKVSVDDMRLYALGREWGNFYNTVFIYVVRTPVPAKEVLDLWVGGITAPESQNEHVAVAAVPLHEKGVTFLLDLVRMERSKELSADHLKAVCGEKGTRGTSSDGELFPTFGRAGIIIALLAEGVL